MLNQNTQPIEMYLVKMMSTLKQFTIYCARAFKIFRYLFWVYLKPTINIKSVGKAVTLYLLFPLFFPAPGSMLRKTS